MGYNAIGYLAVFLPAVILIYSLVPQKKRWIVVLAANYLFFYLLSGFLLLYNVDHACGTPLTGPDQAYEPVAEFAPMAEFKLPEPNVPRVLMETFRSDRPKTVSPRAPEPYATFAETFSYGV